MNITVRIENMQEVIADFRGIADDQIPFATALSLTSTAKLGQGRIQQELPLRFTIRRLSWAKQGIRVTAATKQELAAIVEDIHQYMVLQQEGGAKLPRYGAYICVPLRGAQYTRTQVLPEERRPKAIMASGLGFIRGNIMYQAHFARKSSRKGFRGVGGFSSGSWSRQIVPMYALVHSANIPARYGFDVLVREVVNANWPAEFEKAFGRAMATRRAS